MIGDLIGEWIKGILIDGIMGNLSGLFNTVNTKVGEIASDVGSTPQDWNGGIFSMLQNLSETVIVPIAAAILALVMCYELVDMIVEKNNMHDFDTSMFFRWIFKSAFNPSPREIPRPVGPPPSPPPPVGTGGPRRGLFQVSCRVRSYGSDRDGVISPAARTAGEQGSGRSGQPHLPRQAA